MPTCACCGEERPSDHVAALMGHTDIELCRVCIGWLSSRAGVPDSTPILPVSDLERSTAFFESAGFAVRVYEGGGFAFVEYDGESVFDLSVFEQLTAETNAAGCYLIVRGVDDWHDRLETAGLAVTPVED